VAGNDQDLAIALETFLTEDLLIEGLAREIVNKLNTMRRDEKYEVTDRIVVTFDTTPRVKECYNKYKDYIDNEVLAVKVVFEKCSGTSWDLNGEPTVISIKKA
jgi:isoleucyl-tRNA synthetase